jgi:2,4-dienoyl-CoA reductase-like NADH-dependent reductase (Old Yellow Enzyme family)
MNDTKTRYRTVSQFRTPAQFREYQKRLGIDLPFDDEIESGAGAPLAQPYTLKDGFQIGNRFCTHPMEGWDGTADGLPSEYTFRRWQHFGLSGAKLIWGGEAASVRPDGRANPNQLMIVEANLPAFISLRQALVDAHTQAFHDSSDLLIGLQLTHSGRFARPNRKDKQEPVIAYHHPYLDRKFGIAPDHPVISDRELEILAGEFVTAAALAAEAGFHFVDVKHCHGYLGHELLSAHTRSGDFGGSFENRTRFLRLVVDGIRKTVPGLRIGVRLSAFDTLPYEKDAAGVGVPAVPLEYRFAFGANPEDARLLDLEETKRFLDLLRDLDIELVNLTAGSPYYNPHIQRPAFFPPSDGYLPPEDPLVGVARQIQAARELKAHAPGLLLVGTAYSYLQEWLPNVAQAAVRGRGIDFVGLGRTLLSYWDLPADVLAGRPLDRKRLCRTFSDCTTAPRQGLVSGCYPLDETYKALPQPIKKAAI